MQSHESSRRDVSRNIVTLALRRENTNTFAVLFPLFSRQIRISTVTARVYRRTARSRIIQRFDAAEENLCGREKCRLKLMNQVRWIDGMPKWRGIPVVLARILDRMVRRKRFTCTDGYIRNQFSWVAEEMASPLFH